jgi:hypothetical protein
VKDISSLFIFADLVDLDSAGVDVVTEMMIFDCKVARMRFISFMHRKLAGALVVFMYNDVWLWRVDVPYVHDSVEYVHQRDDLV